MADFTSKNLRADGEYLVYITPERTSKFVARFKRSRRDLAGFKAFLIKNFSVEEYFVERACGMTPVGILEAKGYISKTVQETLKRNGFEPTQEGRAAYIEARVNSVNDRKAAA